MEHRKNKLLNYTELTSMTFEDLQKRLKTNEFVTETRELINELFKRYNQGTISFSNTKIFLTSYILFNYTDIITNNDDYAIKLQELARRLVQEIENLFEEVTTKKFIVFLNVLDKYFVFFGIWKEREGMILIRPIIVSFHNLEKLKVENKDNEELVSHFTQVQNKLKQNVYLIAGPKGVNCLINKKIAYYEDEKIFKDVDATIHKAFWDVFSENIKKGDMEQVTLLLRDIKDFLLILKTDDAFKSKMDEYLDIEMVEKLLEMSGFDMNGIKQYIMFLLTCFEEVMHESQKEQLTRLIEIMNLKFTNGAEMEDVLKTFFEQMFNNMEKTKKLKGL